MQSSDVSNKNCASSRNCISFSMKVLSKDDIFTFTIVHEAPSAVKSDFFVSVFCEYDFDLYEIEKPGMNFPRSSEIHGAVLDNFTQSDPNVAYALKKVMANGNEALWLMIIVRKKKFLRMLLLETYSIKLENQSFQGHKLIAINLFSIMNSLEMMANLTFM